MKKGRRGYFEYNRKKNKETKPAESKEKGEGKRTPVIFHAKRSWKLGRSNGFHHFNSKENGKE